MTQFRRNSGKTSFSGGHGSVTFLLAASEGGPHIVLGALDAFLLLSGRLVRRLLCAECDLDRSPFWNWECSFLCIAWAAIVYGYDRSVRSNGCATDVFNIAATYGIIFYDDWRFPGCSKVVEWTDMAISVTENAPVPLDKNC